MDEYTFIVMAKLKADRLKLQREQRAERTATAPADAESNTRYRRSTRTHWYSREPEWREQS
jgi:hypothetical protein